jgi:hypothetical protein
LSSPQALLLVCQAAAAAAVAVVAAAAVWLLQEDVFVNLEPDREANEGPTGNEGAPVDR